MSPLDVRGWIESGDLRRAASALVVAHGSDVLATCIAMVRDRAAAEDVAQEVFSDAIRALSTFRGDASPRTWLLAIARNRCIDYLRARKRDPWGGALDEEEGDPDAHADRAAFGSEWHADRSLVLRALDALPEGDRALIVLRFKNGLEYDELATAFGLREGTVRMRVSRALARMRLVLESDAAPVAAGAPAPAPMMMPPMPRAPGAPLPMPASRMRAAMPPGASGAVRGAPPSWWTRLKDWARFGRTMEPSVPEASTSHPVGALGLALTALEPAEVSESFAARLGGLVETLPTS